MVKIHLTNQPTCENWYFSYFLKKTYVVGTHQKHLTAALLMWTAYVSCEKKKNIYLIIWILFSAGAMKSLSQDKLTEISCLSSGKWDKLDKSGIVIL